MRVKCHYCGKAFQHYGNWSKFLWCTNACHKLDKKPKGVLPKMDKPKLEGYATWLIEATREQLGYDAKDDSHDDEVEKKLKSGEKISKSKHL